MTAQVPDTCMYDGRRWAVERWHGDCLAIPTNEQLGIKTVSPTTANWSGRIDHFVIHRDKLYLLKIEVNLAEESRDVLPPGAQREVLCRYETMRVWGNHGERNEIHIHRFDYFVFHDLPVPYTGDLFLSYPYIDYWELPYDADDEELKFPVFN
jgi:hypothetical protein